MGGILTSVKYTPDGIPYYTLDEFKKQKRLDDGGQGTVLKGYCTIAVKGSAKKNNRCVAIKLFSKADICSQREIQLLKKHSHPHIVKIFGVIWDGQDAENKPVYLGYVMEYMELGSLHNTIYDTSQQYDMKLVVTWIKQIGSGLMFLHKNGIIHRDIKPKNILLASRDHIKLADFGMARNISGNYSYTTGPIGTDPYMAPEVIGMEKDYGPSADVYSFGITIWEIIHRKCPKQNKIKNCLLEFSMDPNKINEISANFLKRCWAAIIQERPSVEEIIHFSNYLVQTIMVVLKDDPHLPHKIMILDRNVPGYKWKLARRMDFTFDKDALGCEGGCIPCNDELYLIGGGKSRKNLFKILLPAANEMYLTCHRLANMNHGREFIWGSCVYENGFLWVLGGFKEDQFLRSVERYDSRKDTWSIVTDMKYARANAAAAVCNGKIIICGGEGEEGFLLNSVECFDPESGVWTELTPMPDTVCVHTLLNYKSMLVRLGGLHDSNQCTSTVLALDLNDNNGKWIKLEDMISVFDDYAVEVLDQEIFVIGKLLGQLQMLIYNGNNWRYDPSFPLKRESCAAILHISLNYADSLLNVHQKSEDDLIS